VWAWAFKLHREGCRSTSAPTDSRRLRTTCCQALRSSSMRTGLIKKSTAPCVTPRSTTFVSPLDDITAGMSWSAVGHCLTSGIISYCTEMSGGCPRHLTDDGKIELQADVLQQLEAVHVCSSQQKLLSNAFPCRAALHLSKQALASECCHAPTWHVYV
jgi:hypothetical protein